MSARQRRIGVAGVALLLVGIACAGLSRLVAGTEHHAFSPGATPPTHVRVTSGDTYLISVAGGRGALTDLGTAANLARCQWSAPGTAAQFLKTDADPPGDKATDAVASFQAPASGFIQVTCTGWPPVFVDDADNAAGDPAGLLLVVCIGALTLGGGLALSALRSRLLAADEEAATDVTDTVDCADTVDTAPPPEP